MKGFSPFKFSGRISRAQYFGFNVIWGVIGFLNGAALESSTSSSYSVILISIIVFIFGVLASVSYSVRRFHDMDRSGAWVLLCFVPIVSLVVLLILLFAPPRPRDIREDNRFGFRDGMLASIPLEGSPAFSVAARAQDNQMSRSIQVARLMKEIDPY